MQKIIHFNENIKVIWQDFYFFFNVVPETYEYSDINIAYKFYVNRVIQLEYIK